MLSNTRANTVRHTKYTTPALSKLSELPSVSLLIRLLFPYQIPISLFLILMISTYLASELNRERNRSPRPVTNFTGRRT